MTTPRSKQTRFSTMLGIGLLFWWPVVALDPAPIRLPHPMRLLYLFLQMPQNSFLAVSIYDSNHIIFPHYANLVRTWGPDALTDQEFAGATMWVAGDLPRLELKTTDHDRSLRADGRAGAP